MSATSPSCTRWPSNRRGWPRFDPIRGYGLVRRREDLARFNAVSRWASDGPVGCHEDVEERWFAAALNAYAVASPQVFISCPLFGAGCRTLLAWEGAGLLVY